MSTMKTRTKKEAPIFESPDGVPIQITAGRKLAFLRDLARNKSITDAQFRMLAVLVDSSNEGTHPNPELWGRSWLNLPNLAGESGLRKQTIIENTTKLEEAGVVEVARGGSGKGGRENVNKYRLLGWNIYGAVATGPDGSVATEDETVRPAIKRVRLTDETVRLTKQNGTRTVPDSSYALTSETPPMNSRYAQCRLNEEVESDVLLIADGWSDKADGHSVSTSDCMTPRARFEFLRQWYRSRSGKPQPDNDDSVAWQIFQIIDGQIFFETLLMSMDQVRRGSPNTFADHLHQFSLNEVPVGANDNILPLERPAVGYRDELV